MHLYGINWFSVTYFYYRMSWRADNWLMEYRSRIHPAGRSVGACRSIVSKVATGIRWFTLVLGNTPLEVNRICSFRCCLHMCLWMSLYCIEWFNKKSGYDNMLFVIVSSQIMKLYSPPNVKVTKYATIAIKCYCMWSRVDTKGAVNIRMLELAKSFVLILLQVQNRFLLSRELMHLLRRLMNLTNSVMSSCRHFSFELGLSLGLVLEYLASASAMNFWLRSTSLKQI